MKDRRQLSATARAERSRKATKAAVERELLYASILTRFWPAYTMKPDPERLKSEKAKEWLAKFPRILCVESPLGWLSWKLSPEEYVAFQHLPSRPHHGELVQDRTPILLLLATDGRWTRP